MGDTESCKPVTETMKNSSEAEEPESFQINYRWPIDYTVNFAGDLQLLSGQSHLPDARLETPTFPTKHKSETKWKLKLQHRENGHLSLHLYLVSSDIAELQAFAKFKISNRRHMKVLSRSAIFKAVPSESQPVVGFPKFSETSFLTAPADGPELDFGEHRVDRPSFTVHCHISAFPSRRVFSLGPSSQLDTNSQLIRNLESLLCDERLADVTLISSSGGRLRAHRAILSTRSPVFAKMFEHEMLEKQRSVVRISDVEHEVLEDMLYFMYTGRMRNVEKRAAKLLACADKYQLDDLKNSCAEQMLHGLTVENAVDTLVQADRHNMSEFRLKVIDFMNRHAKSVVLTPSFRGLDKSQAYLIVEAYSLLAAETLKKKLKRVAPQRRLIYSLARPRKTRKPKFPLSAHTLRQDE